MGMKDPKAVVPYREGSQLTHNPKQCHPSYFQNFKTLAEFNLLVGGEAAESGHRCRWKC
ncbi:Hypothetical predicted protein [Podarcis lilfordi]|uniref:Uncharacterized protein n=1 Tax=Podarcis lilfordi TaxID=74358 RepID=A0AA35JNY6_9SAUR|nr:Hypothetical predicted protein [Podarcis lilfordi]